MIGLWTGDITGYSAVSFGQIWPITTASAHQIGLGIH